MLDIINKNGMEFIKFKDGKINIMFSIATRGISYKLADGTAKINFERLKKQFNVKKVNYTNQVHGDLIINLDQEESVDREADGLILSKKNEIVGVFTADCVPVILYDAKKNVVSAVHSGWRSTIADISKKAAVIMKKKYNCENIKVIIGPCIGSCCYEVSEELATTFKNKYGNEATNGRMLDLKFAIREQLKGLISEKNIKDLDLCTNCNTEYKLHSYRMTGGDAGRMFSFAFIEE